MDNAAFPGVVVGHSVPFICQLGSAAVRVARQFPGAAEEVLPSLLELSLIHISGSIALTGNSSLQGTKEKGIDDYTGSYTANYEDFSGTEYLFCLLYTSRCV